MSRENFDRWIWKGERDFALANQVTEDFPEMAAYHYQQAAEKFLKAFLSLHQVPFGKTHNIGTLTLICSNIDVAFTTLVTVADVDAITEFATLFRYPNEEHVDFPEAKDLAAAKLFCEAAKKIVIDKTAEKPGTARDSVVPKDRSQTP